VASEQAIPVEDVVLAHQNLIQTEPRDSALEPDAYCQPSPGSSSSTDARYVRLVRFSFLILISRVATL
jgi:hypothetical protein